MIIYGTKIHCDIPLPFDLPNDLFFRCEVSLSSDVPQELKNAITCGQKFYHAHGRNVYLYSDRPFGESTVGQPWCYEVENVLRFYWRGGGQTIYYALNTLGTPTLLGFWFIHLLMPLYLTFEKRYDFLHAGAVEIDGRPVLFIAPTRGGKSTLTDYFVRKGHTLVSDDKVATFMENGRFTAVGSHPYHRPYRKFEELGYRVERFAGNPNPIHAFFVLSAADADAEVGIEEVRGFEKFDALLPNYLYTFSHLKPKRLRYLSEMLNGIRLYRVDVPWDLERLDEVHNAIRTHIRLER